MNWLIGITAVIGLTAEHIITESNARSIFQIERNRFNDSSVDSDVSILLNLSGVLSLLLQNGKAVTESAIIVNQMAEPEGGKVTHTKTKVDTNDEEHIISEPLLSNKELGDADDVIHILHWLGGVLSSELLLNILCSGGDETSLELTAALLDRANVDDCAILFCKVQMDDLSHEGISFLDIGAM